MMTTRGDPQDSYIELSMNTGFALSENAVAHIDFPTPCPIPIRPWDLFARLGDQAP